MLTLAMSLWLNNGNPPNENNLVLRIKSNSFLCILALPNLLAPALASHKRGLLTTQCSLTLAAPNEGQMQAGRGIFSLFPVSPFLPYNYPACKWTPGFGFYTRDHPSRGPFPH